MIKSFAYEIYGKMEVCHPSLGARLCSGIQDGEKSVSFVAVMPFDRAVAAYGGTGELDEEVEILKPIWAETEEEFLARIIAKDLPKDAKNVVLIDPKSLPGSRTFRNAWMIEDGAVQVNMKAARVLHMYKIRQMRNDKLKELDVAYIRADERGDDKEKKEVAEEKQRLRDLPKTFDLEEAKTPEQLVLLWPENLPKYPE